MTFPANLLGGLSGGDAAGNATVRLGVQTGNVRGQVRQFVNGIQQELAAGEQKIQQGSSGWARAFGILKAGAVVTATGVAAALATGAASAISYESAFAGVIKTVDATPAVLERLRTRFRELAKEIPLSANEFARLGEAAGALGVPTANIEEFARVTALIGVTTDVSSDQAATALGQLSNVLQLTNDDYERFASTLVDLGNKGASTESQILDIASRAGAAGRLIGLTTPQILAFSSAVANLGIEVEAGGTALQTLFTQLTLMLQDEAKLKRLGEVAGMSGEQFRVAFQEDALGAIMAFFEGLSLLDPQGRVAALDDLGLAGIRTTRAYLGIADSLDRNLRPALDNANAAWKANTALQIEADKRFETTASRIQLLQNRIGDLMIELGDKLLPGIVSAVEWLSDNVPMALGAIADIWNTTLAPALGGLLEVVGETAGQFIRIFTGDEHVDWGRTMRDALQGVADVLASVAGYARDLFGFVGDLLDNELVQNIVRWGAAWVGVRVVLDGIHRAVRGIFTAGGGTGLQRLASFMTFGAVPAGGRPQPAGPTAAQTARAAAAGAAAGGAIDDIFQEATTKRLAQAGLSSSGGAGAALAGAATQLQIAAGELRAAAAGIRGAAMFDRTGTIAVSPSQLAGPLTIVSQAAKTAGEEMVKAVRTALAAGDLGRARGFYAQIDPGDAASFNAANRAFEDYRSVYLPGTSAVPGNVEEAQRLEQHRRSQQALEQARRGLQPSQLMLNPFTNPAMISGRTVMQQTAAALTEGIQTGATEARRTGRSIVSRVGSGLSSFFGIDMMRQAGSSIVASGRRIGTGVIENLVGGIERQATQGAFARALMDRVDFTRGISSIPGEFADELLLGPGDYNPIADVTGDYVAALDDDLRNRRGDWGRRLKVSAQSLTGLMGEALQASVVDARMAITNSRFGQGVAGMGRDITRAAERMTGAISNSIVGEMARGAMAMGRGTLASSGAGLHAAAAARAAGQRVLGSLAEATAGAMTSYRAGAAAMAPVARAGRTIAEGLWGGTANWINSSARATGTLARGGANLLRGAGTAIVAGTSAAVSGSVSAAARGLSAGRGMLGAGVGMIGRLFWPALIGSLVLDLVGRPIGQFVADELGKVNLGAELQENFIGGLVTLLESARAGIDVERIANLETADFNIGATEITRVQAAKLGLSRATMEELFAENVTLSGQLMRIRVGELIMDRTLEPIVDVPKLTVPTLPEIAPGTRVSAVPELDPDSAASIAFRQQVQAAATQLGTSLTELLGEAAEEGLAGDAFDEATMRFVVRRLRTLAREQQTEAFEAWRTNVETALVEGFGATREQVAFMSDSQIESVAALMSNNANGQYDVMIDALLERVARQMETHTPGTLDPDDPTAYFPTGGADRAAAAGEQRAAGMRLLESAQGIAASVGGEGTAAADAFVAAWQERIAATAASGDQTLVDELLADLKDAGFYFDTIEEAMLHLDAALNLGHASVLADQGEKFLQLYGDSIRTAISSGDFSKVLGMADFEGKTEEEIIAAYNKALNDTGETATMAVADWYRKAITSGVAFGSDGSKTEAALEMEEFLRFMLDTGRLTPEAEAAIRVILAEGSLKGRRGAQGPANEEGRKLGEGIGGATAAALRGNHPVIIDAMFPDNIPVPALSAEFLSMLVERGRQIAWQISLGISSDASKKQFAKALAEATEDGLLPGLPGSPVRAGPMKHPFLLEAGAEIIRQIGRGAAQTPLKLASAIEMPEAGALAGTMGGGQTIYADNINLYDARDEHDVLARLEFLSPTGR